MPLYQYKALNRMREDVEGELAAADADEALARIRNQGLLPTSLREKLRTPKPARAAAKTQEPLPEPAKFAAGRRYWFNVSRKAIIQFTYQFARMQDAGLSILRSLQLLANQQRPGMLRRAATQVCHDVEQGLPLAEAMAKHPRVFDDLYVRMVAVGEMTGDMGSILSGIADNKEKMLRLRRRVIRASIYPAFVVAFAIAVFFFISLVVAPMLGSLLSEAARNAPGWVTFPFKVSGWFFGGSPPGWLKLIFYPVAAWLAVRFIRRFSPGRYVLDGFKLRIPLLGRIFYKIAVARFSRVLGTLIKAGVPILDSLQITRDTTGNEVFARTVDKAHDWVKDGGEITVFMQQSRVFDPVAINMVEVGEETGDLDKTLLKLADIYEEDADTMIAYMASLLEPTLIIIVCVLVGAFVVAMWMLLPSLAAGG